MAALKDTVVSGSLRATDTIYSTTNQFQILRIPTSSNGTTYGPGTNGQILKSNGTSVYWASDNNTTALTSMTGTLGIDHGGTGATSATSAKENLGLGTAAMNFTVSTYNATVQHWGISAIVQSTTQGTKQFLNKRTSLVLTDKGMFAYDVTDSFGIWELDIEDTSIRIYKRALANPNATVINTKILYKANDSNAVGSSTRPIYVTADGVATAISTLATGYGGTGTSTAPTQGGVIYGASTSAYASTAAGTSGQYLKSNGTSAPSWANIKTSDVNPMLTKTYSNYTVTENDGNAGVIYFGTVTLSNTSNYYAPWWVHYTIDVSTSTTQCQGFYDVWVGYCGDQVRYQVFNHFYSGSYYPIYRHRVLYPKSGYSAQGAHLGIRIQSAYNVTTLARTYKINILETYGCSVVFKNSLITYASLYNATYYNSGEIDGTSAGLQETGDSDNRGNDISASYLRITTNTVGIGRYTLFLEDTSGKYQSITSTFNSTGTGHVLNTGATYKLSSQIFYRYAGSDIAANTENSDNNWALLQANIDLRYSTNCGTTLTLRKPVYLVGVPNFTTRTFTLYSTQSNKWWTQTEPTTEDGLIYIYLGTATSNYQIAFQLNNPIYWYKNGSFRRIDEIIPIERGGTGATTVKEAWNNMGIQPGDVIDLDKYQHIIIPGYISGSSKVLLFTLFLGRPINYSCVAATEGYVILRGGSGYLNSHTDPWTVEDTSLHNSISVTATKLTATTTIVDYDLGIINIRLDRANDTAFTNVTNNTPITLNGVPYDSTDSSSGFKIYFGGIVSN